MRTSEKIDLLATALVAVQAELEPVAKDSTNPFFGKNYASLSAVWQEARAKLAAHGLSVAQGLGRDDKDGFLWTMLMHTSGQFVVGECPLILAKRDPQGVGAAMTYYRRYGLAAILGISQEDDDAQSAVDGKSKAPAERKAPPPAQQKAMERTADMPSGAFKFHKKAMEGTADMPSLAAAFGRAKAERERMSKMEFDALTVLKDARKSELNEGRRAA